MSMQPQDPYGYQQQNMGYGQPQGPPPGYQPYPPNYTQTTTTHMQPQTTIVATMPMPTTVFLAGQGGAITYAYQNVNTVCPSCHNSIVSHIDYQIGGFTWLLVIVLFLLGFWLCCWIPFILETCKDIVHSCPNCGRELGRRSRL